MTKEWLIRKAIPADSGKISQLTNESFAAEQRNLFLYGCPGSEHYIEDLIRIQNYSGDSVFIVAVSGEEILGFMEIRRLVDSICLNYAAIAKTARGLGIYRHLFKQAILLGQQEGYNVAKHDVFFGNTIRDYHERLGYHVTKTFLWLTADLPEVTPAGRTFFTGLPQADTIHARYGFSQFNLVTQSHTHSVGRLNTAWFRSSNPNLLNDSDALAALKQIEPERRVLTIYPEGTVLPSSLIFRQVLGSYRLEAEITSTLAALG